MPVRDPHALPLPCPAGVRTLFTRRISLLLPIVFAGCGAPQRTNFPPLRYNYLPPIRLNVATINIEQRYISSGSSPDVSRLDPVSPAAALTAMAQDRLQAFGTAGQATFAITDAVLTKADNVITCTLGVMLTIYSAPGVQAGYIQAGVSRQRKGYVNDLRAALYDITKIAMDAMNVEFEYQIRQHLQSWLATPTAPAAPVQQQPLDPQVQTEQPGSGRE